MDLSPALRDELLSHRVDSTEGGDGDLVLPTRTGGPQNRNNIRNRTLRGAIRRANERLRERGAAAIAEDLTPHSLRHTFASLLFEAGATVPYVMGQLGHEDPKVTLRIYAHVLERGRDHGAELDALVRGSEWAPLGTAGHRTGQEGEPAAAL